MKVTPIRSSTSRSGQLAPWKIGVKLGTTGLLPPGAGATSIIVGHSERRADHGETDAVVRAKAEAALSRIALTYADERIGALA